jgi:hypothetical protein
MNPQDREDIADITRLLDSLRPRAHLGSLLDELRREVRAWALAMTEAAREGTGEAARSTLLQLLPRVADLDEALTVEEDDDGWWLPRSVWSRSTRPLGQLKRPDGGRVDIDELGAGAVLCSGLAVLLGPEVNRGRRAQAADTMHQVINLLQPPRAGRRADGGDGSRLPVESTQLVAVYAALHARLTARAAREAPPLPDVWNASEAAEDGTPLGFDGMDAAEVAYRLLAWAFAYRRKTGWKRLQGMVNDARRAL